MSISRYRILGMITSLLLQQFDLELVTKNPQINHTMGANRPEKTIVRYRRKARSNSISVNIDSGVLACPHLQAQSTEAPCEHAKQIKENAGKAASEA